MILLCGMEVIMGAGVKSAKMRSGNGNRQRKDGEQGGGEGGERPLRKVRTKTEYGRWVRQR